MANNDEIIEMAPKSDIEVQNQEDVDDVDERKRKAEENNTLFAPDVER